jgi:hypothetical protein
MQGDANTLADLAIHGQQAGGVLSPLIKQQAVNLGQSLGLQLDPQTVAAANDTSLFNQLTNKLAPAMRVPGSGSTQRQRHQPCSKGALPQHKGHERTADNDELGLQADDRLHGQPGPRRQRRHRAPGRLREAPHDVGGRADGDQGASATAGCRG